MDSFLTTNNDSTQGRSLARAIGRELSLPIAAMRAVIESLPDTPKERLPLLMEGLLNELDRLDHGIGGLIELGAPHVLCPAPCTVGEIVRAAQEALPIHRRSQVLVALEGSHVELMIDGPEFERCLSSLLYDATEGTSEPVLLHTFIQGTFLEVTIIGGGNRESSFDEEVALREMTRLGAQVNTLYGTERAITISLPLSEVSA